MTPTRFRMFIDDTGQVDNAATNEDERRFASITGVIFEWGEYYHRFVPSFRDIRYEHFGNTRKGTPPVLHRRLLIRGEGSFGSLKDKDKRTAWDSAALKMYEQGSYAVITSCVDKVAFYYHHPNWNQEIYLLLVQNAIERYCFFLRSVHGVGDVMAEEAGGKPDRALRARYSRVYAQGTEQHWSARDVQSVLTSKEIKIKPKSDNIAGLQMADLLAKPSFDHCRSIYSDLAPRRGFVSSVCKILEDQKYYRSGAGNPDGYGRVWRPKSKVK